MCPWLAFKEGPLAPRPAHTPEPLVPVSYCPLSCLLRAACPHEQTGRLRMRVPRSPRHVSLQRLVLCALPAGLVPACSSGGVSPHVFLCLVLNPFSSLTCFCRLSLVLAVTSCQGSRCLALCSRSRPAHFWCWTGAEWVEERAPSDWGLCLCVFAYASPGYGVAVAFILLVLQLPLAHGILQTVKPAWRQGLALRACCLPSQPARAQGPSVPVVLPCQLRAVPPPPTAGERRGRAGPNVPLPAVLVFPRLPGGKGSRGFVGIICMFHSTCAGNTCTLRAGLKIVVQPCRTFFWSLLSPYRGGISTCGGGLYGVRGSGATLHPWVASVGHVCHDGSRIRRWLCWRTFSPRGVVCVAVDVLARDRHSHSPCG